MTANNYVCPDFFLACYFCSRGEPELCDYVLTSAKAQAERDAFNKRAMEAELSDLILVAYCIECCSINQAK